MQADLVQSRQAVFVRCFLKKILFVKADNPIESNKLRLFGTTKTDNERRNIK